MNYGEIPAAALRSSAPMDHELRRCDRITRRVHDCHGPHKVAVQIKHDRFDSTPADAP